MERKKLSLVGWVFIVLVIIGLGALAFLYKDKLLPSTETGAKYQAVFLTNSQVYFGSISNVNGKYVTLKNIYYLQSSQNPQEQNQAQPILLVKLGQELHGPEDVMYINREQILFYEDLKSGSDVVKKIEEYIANQNKESAKQ